MCGGKEERLKTKNAVRRGRLAAIYLTFDFRLILNHPVDNITYGKQDTGH